MADQRLRPASFICLINVKTGWLAPETLYFPYNFRLANDALRKKCPSAFSQHYSSIPHTRQKVSEQSQARFNSNTRKSEKNQAYADLFFSSNRSRAGGPLVRLNKSNMIPMSLEIIMPDAQIPFPLYMLLKKSGRMVPASVAGEALGQKRFATLKRERHKELWVPKTFEREFAKYLAYLEQSWGLVGGLPAAKDPEGNSLGAEAIATANATAELLQGTAPDAKETELPKLAIELLRELELTDLAEPSARQIIVEKCGAFANEFLFCMQAEGIYDSVLAIRSKQSPSDHSMLVGSTAAVMAAASGIIDPRWISNLLLACTFHDIGLIDVSGEVLQKSTQERALKEQIEFENHVARGIELLNASADAFPNDVLRMIHEHHEKPNGKGFPSGLKESQWFDGTPFLILANYFCDLLEGKITGLEESPKAAFVKIFEDAPAGKASRDILFDLIYKDSRAA